MIRGRHAACNDDSYRRAASKVVLGQLLARLTSPLLAHDPSARAQGQWQSVVEQLDRGPINLLHLHVYSAQANIQPCRGQLRMCCGKTTEGGPGTRANVLLSCMHAVESFIILVQAPLITTLGSPVGESRSKSQTPAAR